MSIVIPTASPPRIDERTPLVVRPDMAGTLMTPEEYDSAERADDDGHRYELIRGLLIVRPLPDERERNPIQELGFLLRQYQYEHPEGHHLDMTLPENGIRSEGNRRIADRVIWAGLGRTPRPKTDVPTIVVEFVSKGRRDRIRDYVEKRREYAEAGVLEYWIFDRFERRMTVVRETDSEPVEIVVEADGVYTTPLLPGFDLPIRRLLDAADRFDEDAPETRG